MTPFTYFLDKMIKYIAGVSIAEEQKQNCSKNLSCGHYTIFFGDTFAWNIFYCLNNMLLLHLQVHSLVTV